MRCGLDIVDGVEEEQGLNKTYTGKNLIPCFLEEGVSGFLAEGLIKLPQSQQSLRAD